LYLIGITGGSGSGKTTFTKKVAQSVDNEDVVTLHMDSYYLPQLPNECVSESGKTNYDHPDAFDWGLLLEHIKILKAGNSINAPVYDFATSTRNPEETIELGPAKVVLFEGIFALFNSHIRELMNLKCYMHVDADIRFTRRLNRDVNDRERSLESVIGQYYDTVRPMHQEYLEPQKQFADIIIGEKTDVAIDIISNKIFKVVSHENAFIPKSYTSETQSTIQ
jgi:uridine kinase